MRDIETDRLILRLVPLAGLAATAARDIDACRRIIGARIPDDWLGDSWVAEQRLGQWTQDPAFAPWSIRAIALKETGEIVGYIGAHDKPRPYYHAGRSDTLVEIGYAIFPSWRRQGLAREAAAGFMEFARRSAVRWVRLSIAPGNVASLALARSLGAAYITRIGDSDDGPEDLYLVDLG